MNDPAIQPLGIRGDAVPRVAIPLPAPILCFAPRTPIRSTITLPLWLAVVLLLLAALGGARPPAAPERALVPAAARQPRARRAQHAAEDSDPALQADQARGPDRPAALRPAGAAGGRGARARERDAPRGRDGAGPALRARDRPGVQRLRLLPHRLLARAQRRALALPRAPRLLRRGGPRGDRARRDGRLPDQPPQQHGLHPRRLSRGREGRALLRRRRVGARSGRSRR